MFVSRVRVRMCGFFFALFSGFFCLHFALKVFLASASKKDKRKTLARDDDDDDDVFSNDDDDDDDEFGYVVLEITHQKTPIITACY